MFRLPRAAVLLLALLALPLAPAALAQPAVSPWTPLPGDMSVAAAPGDQRSPAAARGGQHTLIVWLDHVHIHAARVDSSGARVDLEPIVVARDRLINPSLPRPFTPPPAVAWNGQHWLIAFAGQTLGASGLSTTTYILGVRIAADGTVIDQTPITIRRSEDVFNNEWPAQPTAAAGPDGAWVVAWTELGDLFQFVIRAHRISAAGQLLTAAPLTLTSTAANVEARNPQLAGGPEGFLFTTRFGSYGSTNFDVHGRRYDAQMTPLAPFFNLGSGDPQRYSTSRIAASGDEWLVVGHATNAALYGFRVPFAATSPLNTAGVPLAEASSSERTFGAAFDGQNWAIAYGSPLRVGRFTPTLAPTDPQPLTVPAAPGYPEPPSYSDVAAAPLVGGGAIALWQDRAVTADDNIWSSRLPANASPEPRRLVTAEIPSQGAGGIATAADGSGAVVLRSATAERQRILVQRFGPDGAANDAEPIIVWNYTFGSSVGSPDIALSGSTYFIVWPVNDKAWARRMTTSGEFLDPAPVPVLPVEETSVVTVLGVGVAAIGDTALVASYSRQSFNRPYLRYARVRVSDMTVLDPFAPVVDFHISQLASFSTPAVAPVGVPGAQRFLIAYTDTPQAGPSNIDLAFVSPDGAQTTATAIATSGAALPSVAAIGDRALVAYRVEGPDGLDLFGRFFDSTGAAISPTTLLISAPGTQTNPRLAADGAGFLLAWSDFRHEVGQNPLDPSFSDPWAARLNADGVSLDGSGFPLRISPTSELSLRIAPLGPERYIAAYQALTPETPTVYRVGVQFIGDDGGAPTCAADWNGDGAVNSADISAFITTWLASVQQGHLGADFNGDGAVNSSDISAFIAAWLAAVQNGC